MSAFARFAVVVGNPATYEDEADVNILVNVTDVRCQATNAACPGGAGSEYLGKALVTSSVRITDKASYGAGGKATVLDNDFDIPVDCTSTPSTTVGSKCTASTSADAVLPGLNQAGRNAITEVLSVKLKDPGPNGTGYDAGCPPTCGDGDEAIFLGQGWFVP
jgi:hypothetical protein